MEGAPKNENLPTKERVLESIRATGPTPENINLIGEWLKAMREAETSGVDTVKTLIELSELYIEMGDLDGAEEVIVEALENANQEGNLEAYTHAQERLNALDKLRGQ